ncbi:hypothetical protein NM208_g7760 [Fusarium decemcellulare]|uniref:Uncharacterized protein n=1 Tax=Fusarium decemcellulare TaxID=57161 RepID=A0ACC1S7X5_9HYPO|nr:hypothetical protein NM208_g7760 [Fusarium decemcellulare]
MSSAESVKWQLVEVTSPHISKPVLVYAAKNIPYVSDAHRFQNITIYAPHTPQTSIHVGDAVACLPSIGSRPKIPQWHVHIHGGAWRDPHLDSTSIEAAVAHAFASGDPDAPMSAIVSINYTLSPFPTHPTLPYDPTKGDQLDAARDARHPTHVEDVLRAFILLRSLGLNDDSYILSGHSAGACLAFQAALFDTKRWGSGSDQLSPPPRPAALIGLNGLYDLPDLVYELGDSHQQLQDVYQSLLGQAFGGDQSKWPAASPARFDADDLAARVNEGKAARLVLIDQSTEDQLVPVGQADKMEKRLKEVQGIQVVRGHRCNGKHAVPWEEGHMIWESVQDVLTMLRSQG